MTEKKSNLGRKKIPEKDLRNLDFTIALNETEFNQLNGQFKLTGKTQFRTFLRELLLTKSGKIVFQSPVNKELRIEISRMGNNLNQIAHQLNMQIGSISIQEVTQKIGQIEEKLREIKSKIDLR